jgi:hypothetical protein
LSETTRVVERVESVGPCGEQPNLGAEGLACLAVERGEQTGFRRPEAVIEGRKELGAELRGNDSPSSPVGGIGAPLDQVRRFQVIEEVRHDRAVDSEVLGQRELATNLALSGGRQNLVAPRAAGQVSHGGVCSPGIRAQNHAKAPAEVVSQRGVAAGGALSVVALITDLIHHHPIIAGEALLSRSSATMMICPAYS